MKINDNIEITNEDNMVLMARYPDNYFDLAICDPPYGIGIDGQKENIKGKKSDRKYHKTKGWDNKIPSAQYFSELFRVSKNQIIWGANYFVEHLQEGHKGWIIWDKAQHGLTMSDCELAYSSFDCPTRIWTKNRAVLKKDGTQHPTQKPVDLYQWLLQNYAKKSYKILDTHFGSGSHGLAVEKVNKYDKMNLSLTACEIDKEYYQNAIKWLKRETAIRTLF